MTIDWDNDPIEEICAPVSATRQPTYGKDIGTRGGDGQNAHMMNLTKRINKRRRGEWNNPHGDHYERALS